MDNRYFTVQELQALKFYELPNTIYSHILSDLVHLFGVMTDKMLNAFNNSSIEHLNLLSLIPVRSRLFPIGNCKVEP